MTTPVVTSDYAMTKGAAMVNSEFAPGLPLRHATKDAELALCAAHRHGDDVASAVTAATSTASPLGRRLSIAAT